MSTPTLVIILAILVVLILAIIIEDRRIRGIKPQAPPSDTSDRSKFWTAKKDWENRK